MAITAGMVKELREMTGAGMMDCKKALTETNGDMDAAVEVLKKSGAAKMADAVIEANQGETAVEAVEAEDVVEEAVETVEEVVEEVATEE